VASANEAFYDALTNRDLPAMERLWFPADWAECVHPGGPALVGWDAIRDSWRQLLGSTVTISVTPASVRIRIVGDVAWVSCVERIAATDGTEIHSSLAQATNPPNPANTPETVSGQVVKIDRAQGKVTIREGNGKIHEFQASADTLKDLKEGDRIEARLRR